MCKMSQVEHPSVKQGIAVEFFIQTCSFLLTVLPEISRRVLIAAGKSIKFSLTLIRLGLDINSLKAQVDWDTFLKLYCIFEVGNIEM